VTRGLAQRFVVVAFTVALLLAPLATATPTAATNTGGFHWARKTSQFTLQVGSNLSGPWPSILNQVVADWNKGDTVTFRIVAGGTGAQECRPVTGRVETCNWRYGTQEGWLGLTRLYFNDRGDHIQSATVQMNDSFFDTNSEYNNDAARRHTMCHELGHTTGLDHVGTNSCMNDSQFAVFNYLHPINKDFNQQARIYNHTDSTTTVAGKQKKDKKKKKSGKKNKKKSNRDRRQSRAESEGFFSPTSLPSAPSGLTGSETMTVESTEDGGKVVTFITWAEEEATTSSQD
jgi:hypothetical protein